MSGKSTSFTANNTGQPNPTHPETAELTRLTEAEQSLYDDLRENRFGENVRLEQEKIGYEMLVAALERR